MKILSFKVGLKISILIICIIMIKRHEIQLYFVNKHIANLYFFQIKQKTSELNIFNGGSVYTKKKVYIIISMYDKLLFVEK